MAERRMFAKRIIDSDDFTDMPFSTQALYLHLSMAADDDGFINNPKKITRMIGADKEDLERLVNEKYLIEFESGVVVIRHWKMHNYIKPDRYKATVHTEEKKKLGINENGSYIYDFQSGSNLEAEWRQNGSNMDPQDSIGKDRIEKDNIDKDSLSKVSIVEACQGSDFADATTSFADATTTFATMNAATIADATTTKENNLYFSSFSADAAANTDSADPISSATSHNGDNDTSNIGNNGTSNIEDDNTNNIGNNRAPSEDNSAIQDGKKATDKADTGADGITMTPDEGKSTKSRLKPVFGVGRGLVLLSDEQIDSLRGMMGAHVYNIYLEKLAGFIKERGARIKSHYNTIKKWYEEDLAKDPDYTSYTADDPMRKRSFDVNEAMEAAIKRSLELSEDDELQDGEESNPLDNTKISDRDTALERPNHADRVEIPEYPKGLNYPKDPQDPSADGGDNTWFFAPTRS